MDAKNQKPLKDRLKEEMAKRKFSFPKLANETGIPAARMYKWYEENTQPKMADAEKLEAWMGNVEISPSVEKSNVVPVSGSVLEKSLDMLSQAQQTNAASIKLLAEDKIRNTAILEKLMEMLVNFQPPNGTPPARSGPVRKPGYGLAHDPQDPESKPSGKKKK
jgi:transcriptional regulator with XRE-family HTH domain